MLSIGDRVRAVACSTAACCVVVMCSAGAVASRPDRGGPVVRLAPGVVYRAFHLVDGSKPVAGHEVRADLRAPGVSVGLLHPGPVAARTTVSAMVNGRAAVAGVNGDFFDIRSEHPGVVETGSAGGPEVAGGRPRKAAVPDRQRFGPSLPPGGSARDVFGIGLDGVARLGRLRLDAVLTTGRSRHAVDGLNQYALPENGIGIFTSLWGAASRVRATCGSDTRRKAPCAADTARVWISGGRVTRGPEPLTDDAIPPGTTELVGRERGARTLRTLTAGGPARLAYRLTGAEPPFAEAVGAYPILRDGRKATALDDEVRAPHTAVGTGPGGHDVLLVVVDGRSESSGGLTMSGLADLMAALGASDAAALDSGGSSELVTRLPGRPTVTVRNVPSDGRERPVANGLGIFARS
ncbi:phosphodiester glycosidase family protein [Actinocorallia populi]|uniref:phosphodiester glycosidase family protein n=1 Tax=Actinocorallia populi TaxID=2079200 RepID=UPI001300A53D|nr:phosphodiester glycosidase family protein [Actinocorallia populi]